MRRIERVHGYDSTLDQGIEDLQLLNGDWKSQPIKKLKFYTAQMDTFFSSADSFVKVFFKLYLFIDYFLANIDRLL